jgi:PST family polysaccharide transporter
VVYHRGLGVDDALNHDAQGAGDSTAGKAMPGSIPPVPIAGDSSPTAVGDPMPGVRAAKGASGATTTQNLAGRTVRGMYWAYGSFVGLRLTTVIVTAVLARLLVPKEFGLVAIATTIMSFLEIFQGVGISQAIVIASDDDIDEQADAAFTLSVLLGIALTIVAAALGPAAAAFFHQPRLVAIMPVLGSTFLILNLSSTHYSLAMRNIDFRSRTIAELLDGIGRGACGIALALLGAGVWSLVLGYVAGNIALTATLWWLVPWRPRRVRDRRHMRHVLRFGGYVTGTAIMAAFLGQFDNLVVGRVLGDTQLGFYSVATSIPGLLILNIAAVAGQVLFPAFAQLDADALRRGLIASLNYLAAVVFPLTAFLVVLAEPITLAVFGPHWHGAVAAVRVLCLLAAMSPINMVCGNAFFSRGSPRTVFLLAVPQAVALTIGSLIAAPHGIVAVSWVQAAIAVVAQSAALAIATRMFGLSLRSLFSAFVPPLLASVALAAALLGITTLLSAYWPEIAASAATGALVYLAALHLLAPKLLPGFVRVLLSGRREATA